MTLVREQLVRPGGGPATSGSATVRLIASTTDLTAPGYAGTSTILGRWRASADALGIVAFELEPTSLITIPVGTVYEIITQVPGSASLAPRYFTVPTVGPAWIKDWLSALPGALPTPELAVETAARIAADNLRALLTDARLTDQRTPLDGSVTGAKVAAALIDPAAGTAGLRTLGTGAAQAIPGNTPVATLDAEGKVPIAQLHRVAPQTIAQLGDSILAAGTAFTAPTPLGPGTVGSPSTSSVGPLTWAQIILRDRLTVVGCKAQGGYGLNTWLNTYSTQVDALIATKPRWLLVHIGTNDIGLQGRTSTQLIADFQTLLGRCQVAGVPVILTTIMPRGGATYTLTTTQETYRLEVNNWLRAAPITHRGVTCLEWSHPTTNGLSGANTALFDSSVLHPNSAGGQVLGKILADYLAPQTVPVENLTESTDPSNIIANGLMAGASASGLATPGWSVINQTPVPVWTATKVTRTDGPGEWQKINITTQGALILRATIVTGVNVVVGNRYVAEFTYRNAAFSALDQFKLYCLVGGYSTQANATATTQGAPTAASFPASGVFRTLPVYAQATPVSIYFDIYLAGLGSVELTQCRVRSIGP